MCGQSKTSSPTEGRATAGPDVDSVAARLGRLTRWPSREARHWVERFVLAASRDASTAAVVMFGSIARPVDKAQDVDLLYVYRDGKMQLPDQLLRVSEHELARLLSGALRKQDEERR